MTDKLKKASRVLGSLPAKVVLQFASNIKKKNPEQLCHFCKQTNLARDQFLSHNICKKEECEVKDGKI